MRGKMTFLMTVLAVMLIFTPMLSVQASDGVAKGTVQETTVPVAGFNAVLGTSGIMPLWEELEWQYRIYDGYFWKRQWSITYGKWVGEWIRLNPYPNNG
jgi:hypothetical protein